MAVKRVVDYNARIRVKADQVELFECTLSGDEAFSRTVRLFAGCSPEWS